jgi:tripartite-type tricarboxylate transporter receptor subunit TctC
MLRRAVLTTLLSFAATAALIPASYAQELPPGPVRMQVGFAAGGSTDAMARIIAEKLSERIGRSIVVENNAGASGRLAAESVKRAAPDGSTLLVGNIGMVVLAPVTFKTLSYDPLTDFEPVARAADFQMALAAAPVTGAKDVAGFVSWMKANPDKANMAVPLQASLSHLTALRFVEAAGIKSEMVIYRGTALAMQDLLSGRLPGSAAAVADFAEQHRAGTLKVLAVSGTKRSTALPDVPTFGEAGMKGFEGNGWNGFLLPAGTPKAIVERYNREILDIVRQPDVEARLAQLGFVVPEPHTPAEFAATIKAGQDSWRPLVKAAGLEQ